MSNKEQVEQLTQLFAETGKAHHQAFIEVDGEDAEWALWYADYLQDRLTPILGNELTKSEITYCLVSLSKKQPVISPESWWPEFYARYFSEHYGYVNP